MNEPADIVAKLDDIIKWVESSFGTCWTPADVNDLRQARDMIERLSSAPAKDECASPRDPTPAEISNYLRGQRIGQNWALKKAAAMVEHMDGYTGAELAANIRSMITAFPDTRGEANPSPVADTEAMEAARALVAEMGVYPKDQAERFRRDVLLVARALLARQADRAAVIEDDANDAAYDNEASDGSRR